MVQYSTDLSNASGTLAVANGGTGQATAQAALDALAGGVTAARVLAGNGTHVTLRAVAAADLAGLFTQYKQVSASATPSATLGVFGAAVTLSADAGFTGFLPVRVSWTTSGLATETITVQSVTTFSDNSTATTAALTTSASNGPNSLTDNTVITMLGAVDGKIVKSVAFSVKSSIGSSAGSATFAILGLNLP